MFWEVLVEVAVVYAMFCSYFPWEQLYIDYSYFYDQQDDFLQCNFNFNVLIIKLQSNWHIKHTDCSRTSGTLYFPWKRPYLKFQN